MKIKIHSNKFTKAQQTVGVLFIGVVVVVGAIFIFASHAASPSVSVAATSGTLSGPATISSSSSGNYVKFGTQLSGGGGRPLLGFWSNGSVGPTSLNVTQQIYTDFAYPGGGSGTFSSYSVPSTPYQIMLSVGDLNSSQASSIGNALVSAGKANTIFRVMWEQNQDLSGWFQAWNELTFSASQYISAFQNVVTELRAVPNNHFTFVWNPNAGEGNNKSGESTYSTWPGASYVNYVGVDVYDYGGYQANTQEILDFASGHPLSGWPQLSSPIPVAFPEWGLNGSDDTTFMNYLIGVMKNPANNVQIQSYFSCGPSQGCTSPDSDLNAYPNSKSAYETGFAGM